MPGVSPKVASTLMGHKTPEYQPGAASITLRRCTHTLPRELERARDLLDTFLNERTAQEATGCVPCLHRTDGLRTTRVWLTKAR
jgi:hypothetical protein